MSSPPPSPPRPPSRVPIGIAGTGRAGSLLSRALLAHGVPIRVWDRKTDQVPRDLIPHRDTSLGELIRLSRTVILAVADRAIVDVAAAARTLAEDDTPRAWVHLSGALGAGILAPVVPSGDIVAAMHPLQTIAPGADPRILHGALAAIDAPEDGGLTLATTLARLLGMHPVPVPPAIRPGYHAAGALASGGLTAVLVTAREVLEESGLSSREIREGLRAIASTALEAALTDNPDEGWTGPVVRGDASTLRAQLAALDPFPPEVADLFRALMRTILVRLDHHSPLPVDRRDEIRALLTEPTR